MASTKLASSVLEVYANLLRAGLSAKTAEVQNLHQVRPKLRLRQVNVGLRKTPSPPAEVALNKCMSYNTLAESEQGRRICDWFAYSTS